MKRSARCLLSFPLLTLLLSLLVLLTACSQSSGGGSGAGSNVGASGSDGPYSHNNMETPKLLSSWVCTYDYKDHTGTEYMDVLYFDLYENNHFAYRVLRELSDDVYSEAEYKGSWHVYEGEQDHSYHFVCKLADDTEKNFWGKLDSRGHYMTVYETEGKTKPSATGGTLISSQYPRDRAEDIFWKD